MSSPTSEQLIACPGGGKDAPAGGKWICSHCRRRFRARLTVEELPDGRTIARWRMPEHGGRAS